LVVPLAAHRFKHHTNNSNDTTPEHSNFDE
jgi:hypothetical protein